MTQSVVLKGVEASYGGQPVLEDFDMEVRAGEFLAILGPSGCGKSTLLSLIAGFLTPTRGSISIGERDVSNIPPQGRKLSIVFQNYALFPHMTVFENVAYGLKVRRLPKADISRRVAEALASVGLKDFAARYPRQLSGGQQQRVSLARAIVVEPDVLLLDEPLSNLDAKLRREMRSEIKALQRRKQTTTILVTHDQDEALSMADRVAVMQSGKICQIAPPTEVYRTPATHFVADFVGRVNVFSGIASGLPSMLNVDGGMAIPLAEPRSGQIKAIVRPEAVRLIDFAKKNGSGYGAVVKQRSFVGSAWEYDVELDGGPHMMVTVRPDGHAPEEGARVAVDWKPEDLIVVDGGRG